MRRPGRSRAHERRNRVPFVRYSSNDTTHRGSVFPRGDSQSGPLAPLLLDRQQFHDSPINSSAIQNHRPSHRPSSTSLTESPLRGSAGVPQTCIAGRTLLLYRRPHACVYRCCSTARDETGAGRAMPRRPCPRLPQRALGKRERATPAVAAFSPARRCFCPPPQPLARCAHGTAPVRRGYFIERYCK